jgi:hypothetical protein
MEGSDPQVASKGYFLVAVAVFVVASIIQSLRPFGSKKWPLVDAVVTDNPQRSDIPGYHSVKVDYSYQINGTQYTGRHREHVDRWDDEFPNRFPKGRTFVVRVKPGRPEISVMRDDDQPNGVRQRLERIDEERTRRSTRN